jgi:two-component system, NtrC family, response regulator AtoC
MFQGGVVFLGGLLMVYRATDVMIGKSQPIRDVLNMVERVAPSNANILIQGESGVGKELVAQAIHRQSPRHNASFVVIDCTALQETLLESELFGHERGAYTSATHLKYGLFEVAHGGVVLLDEIGELCPTIQSKLLRVLETGTFRRVGGTRDIHVDVRVLAATNRNLDQLVTEGAFRGDLYYRLNVVSIQVPPLRARPQDIPYLVCHFISRTNQQTVQGVSDEAMTLLMHYQWPGNVRELRNIIERAALLSQNQCIDVEDLPMVLRNGSGPQVRNNCIFHTLREAECNHIVNVLSQVCGHRARAAEILGISERQLYRKLNQHNLS